MTTVCFWASAGPATRVASATAPTVRPAARSMPRIIRNLLEGGSVVPFEPRAMIRAHLRRSVGGGLDGPLRSLPQESVARAKPALEPERLSLGGAISGRLPACHVRVFLFRAPALPAQRILGGGIGRGAKPPSECLRRWRPRPHAQRTESTPRVRPSGAALQLDPSHRSSQSVSPA